MLGLYGAGVATTRPSGPQRLLVNYGFTLWFYLATSWMVPALPVPIANQTLLDWDQRLFGHTPSMTLQALAVPWLTDLMSLFYLS